MCSPCQKYPGGFRVPFRIVYGIKRLPILFGQGSEALVANSPSHRNPLIQLRIGASPDCYIFIHSSSKKHQLLPVRTYPQLTAPSLLNKFTREDPPKMRTSRPKINRLDSSFAPNDGMRPPRWIRLLME
jgi:hypothetical protein